MGLDCFLFILRRSARVVVPLVWDPLPLVWMPFLACPFMISGSRTAIDDAGQMADGEIGSEVTVPETGESDAKQQV